MIWLATSSESPFVTGIHKQLVGTVPTGCLYEKQLVGTVPTSCVSPSQESGLLHGKELKFANPTLLSVVGTGNSFPMTPRSAMCDHAFGFCMPNSGWLQECTDT